MEAEYIAAAEATRDVTWVRSLIGELGFKLTVPTTLHVDNQSANRLYANPSTHSRSKHIDIKHHIIRERIEMGTIELEYVETAMQRADFLTKPLPGPNHAINFYPSESQSQRL